jgi:hypothetical protein
MGLPGFEPGRCGPKPHIITKLDHNPDCNNNFQNCLKKASVCLDKIRTKAKRLASMENTYAKPLETTTKQLRTSRTRPASRTMQNNAPPHQRIRKESASLKNKSFALILPQNV